MTDERQRQGSDSRARPTARDVPFTRGAGSESEPAPRGQRPNQLPRDPTYEAELATVELAVLRDRERQEDPSTKQGGRLHRVVAADSPESVTPESPGARAAHASLGAPRSVEAPSSSGRSVASGTLLSVGAVDPRGRTEPTLETPRMFFSQPDGGEVYFKPGKIPAVTVHQTLETETVKLSDSIDPRRAKTMPRIDRAALARFSEGDGAADSESPVAVSRPPVGSEAASGAPPTSGSVDYEAASSLGDGHDDGQIHASLSPFRDQGEPSFALNDAPTRPEPLAARRETEPGVGYLPPPDTSATPTHRDLPIHRIEASLPPPPPASAAPLEYKSRPRQLVPSSIPASEGPSPTTASIAAPEPRPRSWTNYVGFLLALLLAVALGVWLTRHTEQSPVTTDPAPPADVTPKVDVRRVEVPTISPAPPAPLEAPAPARARPVTELGPAPTEPTSAPPAPLAAPPATRPTAALPRKSSPPKPPRETIF